MARFSVREGRSYGRWGRPQTNQPSHSETVRDERQFVTDLGGGLVRVDVGAPIPRLSSEPQANLKVTQAAPEAPAVEPEPPSAPSTNLRAPSAKLPDFKPGLGKG